VANTAPVAPGAGGAAPAADFKDFVVDTALRLDRGFKDAVVPTVAPAVSAAIGGAADDAAYRSAVGVGAQVGAAGGQAAVTATYKAARDAGFRHGGGDVGRAAEDAACYLAALAPVQVACSSAVGTAVQ